MTRAGGPNAGPPGGVPAAVNTKIPLPGTSALAGKLLLEQTISRVDLDDRTKAIITKQLAGLLPGQVVQVGKTSAERTVNPDALQSLLPSAAIAAAGLDPAKTPNPPPPVLWVDGANRLLVELATITASLGDGLVEMSVPVSCDQTGEVAVTITFVTGTPDKPTGGVAATEDHPRGPAVIVDNWHEALIAFAWHTLQIATSSLAGIGASDPSGRPLITNALSVTANGIGVLPQARHTFFSGGLSS